VGAAERLTGKQARFCAEYLADFNATQAAIRAGYSAKTAAEMGCENLNKPNIQAEIRRLGLETAQKLDVSRERVMRELAAIAFARASDVVRVTTEKAPELGIHPITGEVVTALTGWRQSVKITDTDELPDDILAAVASVKQGANGIEVKLHDKIKPLELLGKMLGMFDGGNTQEEAKNNLFEAIVSSAEEELRTDDISEIEPEAASGADVVEPPGVP
jgi:phage terminase small subunit